MADNLLDTIFLGEVASVQNYGAFIKIPGSQSQGLVHKSQISNGSVDDASEVLHKGDRVWCKAIRVTDDGKLSLSMKVVDQGNGRDLDPNGVQIQTKVADLKIFRVVTALTTFYISDEQKRRERPTGSGRKKIELEAVLNTTCTKCGTRGHIARDCFKDPGGKTYELLPDDEDFIPPSGDTQEEVVKPKKEKRKSKKEKKNKKKKKRRSTSSENSSSSEDERRKKKKSKKRSSSSPQREKKKQKKER